MPPSDDDRRRFARSQAAADIAIVVDGVMLKTARVVDVSLGGALVELDVGVSPPTLGAAARATVKRNGAEVERHARVVRVRWGGRERGKVVPAAVAFAFEDPEGARELATLLSL
jgi:hypothetical protein